MTILTVLAQSSSSTSSKSSNPKKNRKRQRNRKSVGYGHHTNGFKHITLPANHRRKELKSLMCVNPFENTGLSIQPFMKNSMHVLYKPMSLANAPKKSPFIIQAQQNGIGGSRKVLINPDFGIYTNPFGIEWLFCMSSVCSWFFETNDFKCKRCFNNRSSSRCS